MVPVPGACALIAALSAALELGSATVLVDRAPGSGSSPWAQGGMAAAVGPDDDVADHASFAREFGCKRLIHAADDVIQDAEIKIEANQPIGTDRINLVFGIYEDRYRLFEGRWRFDCRNFTLQHVASLPAAEITEFAEFEAAFPIGL